MIEQHTPRRALVVDDEPGVRELLREFLAIANIESEGAEDGAKAIEYVDSHSVDIVIMDVNMPGVSGIDALRVIKRDHPDQLVLVVSGVAEVDVAVEAMRLGAQDYILKPFSVDVILAKVHEAFHEAAHAQEELEHQRDHEVAAREREVNSLNRMFQAHLNERAELSDRWSALSGAVHRIVDELDSLKDKIQDMDSIEERVLPTLVVPPDAPPAGQMWAPEGQSA